MRKCLPGTQGPGRVEGIDDMEFINLKRQQQQIRGRLDEAIARVLDHGRYVMGPEVEEVEQDLARYCGVPHAVGVASGTDALLIALMALGVGPGDAVLTTPFTFVATAEVIQLLGARPVFVDVDPQTFNIDPQALEEAVARVHREGTHRLAGIIPVDLFGQPADYTAINALARKHDLFVLEDAAQSFGARAHGRQACALSEISATSFFPAKPLGCYGDGGMIFTQREDLLEALRSLRVHGAGGDRYQNIRIGVTGRLDTLQAAILLAKMEIFQQEMEQRQEVAGRYHTLLEGVVGFQEVREWAWSAWAQFAVLHPRRDALMEALKQAGIPSAIYYPIPLHLQPVFARWGGKRGDCPVSERLAGEIFALPFDPWMTAREQEEVAAVLCKACR